MPDQDTQTGMFRLVRMNPESNWEGQWGFMAANDQREAGQLGVHDHGQVSQFPYIITQRNRHLKYSARQGILVLPNPTSLLALFTAGHGMSWTIAMATYSTVAASSLCTLIPFIIPESQTTSTKYQ
ncbi:MAG: hypothetical protein R2795_02365 [Saprospiraceae bacterium]